MKGLIVTHYQSCSGFSLNNDGNQNIKAEDAHITHICLLDVASTSIERSDVIMLLRR